MNQEANQQVQALHAKLSDSVKGPHEVSERVGNVASVDTVTHLMSTHLDIPFLDGILERVKYHGRKGAISFGKKEVFVFFNGSQDEA